MKYIVEKLNIFSNILLDNKLIQQSIHFFENQSDDENYKWESSQGFIYLSEQNLMLYQEYWHEMLDRVKMQKTQQISDLAQYFDYMYGAKINFENSTLFLNEYFVKKDGIEKYQALQELIKVKLNEEMAAFLRQYPDLLSLFLAVRNKDLAVLQQAKSIATVELLGKAIPDYYAKFCQEIREGKTVNRAGMTFYILQYAMLTRYFPQTGQLDWMSKEYHVEDARRGNQLSLQKQKLIQEARLDYAKKLKEFFLENSDVIQLQKEVFPLCSHSAYEQSVQDFLKKYVVMPVSSI